MRRRHERSAGVLYRAQASDPPDNAQQVPPPTPPTRKLQENGPQPSSPSLTPFLPLSVCTDEFNPFVPKLEKSVSGSSSSRDRLLLTVTMLLLAALFIS